MTGINGKPLEGAELFFFALVVVAILAFVFYVFVLAPRRMQAKEAAEAARRKNLTETQRRLEDKEKERIKTEKDERSRMESQAQKERNLNNAYGEKVSALICPHCQSKGSVRRTEATRVTKTRVNSVAARAVGLGTNTEKKVQQLRCDACEMTWDVS
jgi:Flp pilus assembly protein TadB